MHQWTVRSLAARIDSFTVAFLSEWYRLGNEYTVLLLCLAQLPSSSQSLSVSMHSMRYCSSNKACTDAAGYPFAAEAAGDTGLHLSVHKQMGEMCSG